MFARSQEERTRTLCIIRWIAEAVGNKEAVSYDDFLVGCHSSSLLASTAPIYGGGPFVTSCIHTKLRHTCVQGHLPEHLERMEKVALDACLCIEIIHQAACGSSV
eukprot:6271107-Amphidinium_carterae.1